MLVVSVQPPEPARRSVTSQRSRICAPSSRRRSASALMSSSGRTYRSTRACSPATTLLRSSAGSSSNSRSRSSSSGSPPSYPSSRRRRKTCRYCSSPRVVRATTTSPVECVSKSMPGLAVAVVELERPPVQLEQRAQACVEARGRGAAPELPEPTHERRVERGAEDERIPSRDELRHALANHSGRRQREGQAGNDPAGVPARDAATDLAALEQRHRSTRTGQLPGAGKPDDATADDDDRGALHDGNASASVSGAPGPQAGRQLPRRPRRTRGPRVRACGRRARRARSHEAVFHARRAS